MPQAEHTPSFHQVEHVAAKLGASWPAIVKARQVASTTRRQIAGLLKETLAGTVADDTSVVVFGSLARGDWTQGSDIDWTLLVDGPAVTDHRQLAQTVAATLDDAGFSKPGTAGVFGNLAFSHDIIHHVGGERDTNFNTTRRILLLLESAALTANPRSPATSAAAYERVIDAVLHRYLADDLNFLSSTTMRNKVPRFLLNDIVRFWRTMCVDCAWKEWEQSGRKWAMRNAKLRMSRKLLFVSGLLTCFSCYRNPSIRGSDDEDLDAASLLEHLSRYAHQAPMDIVVHTLVELGCEQTLVQLLNAYDGFLAILENDEMRKELQALSSTNAYQNKNFLRIRELSHEFQDALVLLFFDSHPQLADFTRKYGVF